MSKPLPDTASEAIAFGQYREWLEHPQTRSFFAQLEQDRVERLTKASVNSLLTAIDNAKEHNNLVAAATILQIINTYGHPDRYPIAVRAPAL